MSLQQQIPNSGPPRKRSQGIVNPHQPTVWQRIAAELVAGLIRLVDATLRYRWHDDSGYNQGQTAAQAIYAIWHNRLILSMPGYHGTARNRAGSPGLAALVSASKDGALLAGILSRFNVQAVRGSSSRRGAQALLELTTWAERGFDLAITPDGPRGPCYHVQEGVISLAQVTGLPIIPVSCDLQWKLRLNSWDRFQIPLPFSRCDMRVGKPVVVPREADDAQREFLRQQLEKSLRELSRD